MASKAGALNVPGVVVSAGKMMKTVTVRMARQHWNRRVRKSFTKPFKILVNDPNSSLVEGDVIMTTPEKHSKHVKHTVSSIVAPFGKPIEERPALMTAEEREAVFQKKHGDKLERRRQRREEAAILLADEQMAGKKKRKPFGVMVDDGGAPPGKGPDGQGRVVLPQGLHKFGKINEEAIAGQKKAIQTRERAIEHEGDAEEAKEVPEEEYQKEALKRDPGI